MARGFVKHALEASPLGLDDEIHWLYYTRGKLRKVIEECNSLIALSRVSKERSHPAPRTDVSSDDRAIHRLTLGGILPLERTLAHLRALMASHT